MAANNKNGQDPAKLVEIHAEINGKIFRVKANNAPLSKIFKVLNEEQFGCLAWQLISEKTLITDCTRPLSDFSGKRIDIISAIVAGGLREISKEGLKKILEEHKKWLEDSKKGNRANLRYADLSSADLSSANLRSANLRYADLSSADLRYADLRYADLSSANLRSANLRYADLSSANLRSADLSSADLSSADLRSADLSYADLSSADLRYADLSSANLRYADLSSANLYNITLPDNAPPYLIEASQLFAKIRNILNTKKTSEEIGKEIEEKIQNLTG